MTSHAISLQLKQDYPPILNCEFAVPIPEIVHQVLGEDIIRNRRVAVIGDVHGCLEELRDFIKEHNITANNTVVVFVGDIIDKGPRSIETLRFIRDLGAFSVRGNHEDKVIHEWYKLADDPQHQLTDKLRWISGLENDDINFLTSLPYSISIPVYNTIVVHAGLDPWKSLLHQQPIDMILTTNIVNSGDSNYKLVNDNAVGVSWLSCWNGPQHVYFGHDAKRGLQRGEFGTGLDTGCVFGRKLTGVLLHRNTSEEIVRDIVSVDAKSVYHEKKTPPIRYEGNKCSN